jgi:Ca2+/Na+ antiporter
MSAAMKCGVQFVGWWTSLMGSFAVLALIVIGLGLMIRKLTPAEALKYGVGFVGIAVVLIQLMKVLVCFWCSMAIWQQVLLFVALLVFWLWRQKSLQPSKGKDR